MADDSRDDADNEITRIVRRPGPAQLPINLMRPAGPTPPAGNDAIIPPPLAASPANDSVPPVAPPNMFDRPRPVMTPPPRPVMTPPSGGAPLGSTPIGGSPVGAAPVPPAPPFGGPTPVVVRPTPPVSLEPRAAPIPSPIATPAPSPLPGITPAPAPVVAPASTDHAATVVSALPVAEPAPAPAFVQPEPVVVPAPEPIFAPAPIVAEAPKPFVRPAPIAAPVAPVVAPVVAAPAPVLAAAPAPTPSEPVVGWLVIVKGPGRGTAREMVTGRNPIGSASGQAIRLDFGDPAIAPQGHAYMVYDEEDREFFVEDGKQKVVVRLNGKLLTETMPIRHGDELRIGATTLRFVALCGPDFDWHEKEEKPAETVASDEPLLEEKPTIAEESISELKLDDDRSDVWHANPDSID